VDAAVRTPAGGLLGPPSHLKVRSTAYGTITAWLTAIAGGLLVLLAARRVWRRVRGEEPRPTARVDPSPPPTVDPAPTATGPTVRLPIPDHGPAPPVPELQQRPPPVSTAPLGRSAAPEDAAPTERLPRPPSPRPRP
jgi:hypothetical protein